jgi:hypothetical protein
MAVIVFRPYSPENTSNAGKLANILRDTGAISIERNHPELYGNMRGAFRYTVNSHIVEFHFDGEEEMGETLETISTWETVRLISNYCPLHGENLYIEDNGSVNISEYISTLTGDSTSREKKD